MSSEVEDNDNQVNEPESVAYNLSNGLELVNSVLPKIRLICKNHHVYSLDVFGSALKGPFTPNSDIDFLVKFLPVPLEDYFENYINLKVGLEQLLGRRIDLLEQQTLQNPYLIQSIKKDHLKIYGD